MNCKKVFSRKHLTIGLLWHSLTSDNLGVGALTESQIAIVHSAALRINVNVNFIVFGTTGSRLEPFIMSNVTLGDRFSIKRMLLGQLNYINQLKACDIVLDIGEGDSFSDIYGLERFRDQTVTKAIVLALGKPLILSPQTIGPFERSWTAIVAIWLMKRAYRVYARDVLSKSYLTQLGIMENTDEAIDVAFRLPYTPMTFLKTEKVRVGLNVSGLLYAGGYSGNNQFGLAVDYRELVERLIEYFISLNDCELHLVGHVLTEHTSNEDDYFISLKLASQHPGIIVAEKFQTPSAAKSYISTMDYFVGARMHACIAAFSAGVPVTPIAYSRKFAGLFITLGYDWVADCKSLDTNSAIAMVIEGYANREQLRNKIIAGNIFAEQKLQSYEDFLVTCLDGINV